MALNTLSQQEDHSVDHLTELGYVDPDAVALRDAVVRQQLEAELQQARQCLARGETVEAVRALERLAAEDDGWISPRRLLADIYFHSGQVAQAQLQLDWLAEHAVEHPRIALISGTLALGRRDLAAAVEELEYASYVEPDLASVHTLLGSAYLRQGRLACAQQEFEHALKNNAGDATAYSGLAATALRQNRVEEAACFALESLERNLQLFTAHYYLGVALTKLGRILEAITALETAAKVAPDRVAPYRWLARIAKQKNNEQQAARYRELGREIVRRRRSARVCGGGADTLGAT